MKTLIIGFGSIGKKHFEALKDLGGELAVLSKSYDKNEFKGQKFTLFRDFKQIPLNEFELFIIANITTSHFEMLLKIDKAVQGKTILVEKPIFEHFKPYKSKKNKIIVAYLLRFNPIIMALKALLKEAKKSGEKPYFASFECHSYLPKWRALDYTKNYSAKKELGGGVALDLSHELDLACFLFKKPRLKFAQIAKISALKINSDDFSFFALQEKSGFKNTFKKGEKCDLKKTNSQKIDFKNSANTQKIGLKNKGAKIHISLSYFSKFNTRQICIHSPKHSYKADLLNNFIEIYDENGLKQKMDFKSDTISTLKALHTGILSGDKNLCSLKEGLRILKIIDKARGLK